jgi:hypothetical protein
MLKIKKIHLTLTDPNPEITPEGYEFYHCITIPIKISQLKQIIDNEIIWIFREYFDNIKITFINNTGGEEEWIINEDLINDENIIKNIKKLIQEVGE